MTEQYIQLDDTWYGKKKSGIEAKILVSARSIPTWLLIFIFMKNNIYCLRRINTANLHFDKTLQKHVNEVSNVSFGLC